MEVPPAAAVEDQVEAAAGERPHLVEGAAQRGGEEDGVLVRVAGGADQPAPQLGRHLVGGAAAEAGCAQLEIVADEAQEVLGLGRPQLAPAELELGEVAHVARVAGVGRVGEHRGGGLAVLPAEPVRALLDQPRLAGDVRHHEVEHDLEAVLARRLDEPADEVGRALVRLAAHERVQLEGVGDGVDAARGAGRPEGVDVDPVEPHAGDARQVLPPRVDRPRQQRVQVVDARRCCSHWTDRDCTPTRPELDRSPDRASGERNGTRRARFRPAPGGGSPCPSSARWRSSPRSTRRTSTAAPASTWSIWRKALAKRVAGRGPLLRRPGRRRGGNLAVRGYPQWDETKRGTDPRFVGAIDAFARSLAMAKDTLDAQRGPLPHLVHRHGRHPGRPALGRALRADHPLAGAAAAVEGRAARQRLPPQRLDRADRDRAGRTRRRRLARDPRGRAAAVRREARARPRHPQRHRPRRVPRRSTTRRRAGPPRHRPGAALRPLRRPHHAPEGDHPPRRRDPGDRPRAPGRALRRRARHAGDRQGDGGGRGRA